MVIFYKNGVFLGAFYVFVLMKCVNTNVGRLNLFHKAEVVYMSVNPQKRLMSSGLVGRLIKFVEFWIVINESSGLMP